MPFPFPSAKFISSLYYKARDNSPDLHFCHKFLLVIRHEMDSHESETSNRAAKAEQVVARRVERLFLQINPLPELYGALEMAPCAGRAKIDVDGEKMSEYMKRKYTDLQLKVYEYFNSRPELHTPLEISKDEHRELCMNQMMGVVREAGIRPFRYVVDEPAKYFAIIEAVGSIDMSLGIKMGVQYR